MLGGALDRQHGLDFDRNRQMSLVSSGLQNELKDSLPVKVSDIVMDTSSAVHNEELLTACSQSSVLNQIGLFRGLVVSTRCHYGLVKSFDLHIGPCRPGRWSSQVQVR